MAELIRLVIWDLDETFWKGTVTEGGITEYVQAHHDIVIELARRGIISSICSKNDPAVILPILKEAGILEYFVLPSISWEPKGARLAQLIETFHLRPQTVLFIDDNPGNRAEALAAVPGLHVRSEAFIARLLRHPGFQGKDDRALTRLRQYRLLETRALDRQRASGANEDFLRSSAIRLRIEYDVERYLDRAIELINRTNQLNYTKQRLPEDLEAARAQLRQDLAGFDSQAGLIEVADKYGHYGMVGFFLTRSMRRTLIEGAANSHLQHFCFSCRTLGMRIEQWVYEYLGRPELDVVGAVLTDLGTPCAIDWITHVDSLQENAVALPQIAPQIVLWGGCETNAIGTYLNAYTPRLEVFGNYAAGGCFLRIASAALLLNLCRNDAGAVAADARTLGLPLGLLAQDVLGAAAPGTLFVFNFSQDAGGVFHYRHKSNRLALLIEPREWPGNRFLELTEPMLLEHFAQKGAAYSEEQRQHVLAVDRHLREHFEPVSLYDETPRLQLVRQVLERVPVGAKVILAVDHDEVRHEPQVLTPVPEITRWGALLRGLAAEHPYVGVIAFSDLLQSPDEIQLYGNHYDRAVYLRFAQEVVRVAGELAPKTFQSGARSWWISLLAHEQVGSECLKSGWSAPETHYTWTDGNLAVLEFGRIDGQFDYSLRLDIDGVAGPSERQVQRIAVTANDTPVGQLVCRGRMQPEFFVPRAALTGDTLTLCLSLPDAISPHSFAGSGDQRLLGLAVKSIALDPFGSAEERSA